MWVTRKMSGSMALCSFGHLSACPIQTAPTSSCLALHAPSLSLPSLLGLVAIQSIPAWVLAHPPRSSPHPPRSSPHPPRILPASSPHPPRSSPHPPRSSPHPPRILPASSPHPPRSSPHPPRSSPHPPRSSPHPPRILPERAFDVLLGDTAIGSLGPGKSWFAGCHDICTCLPVVSVLFFFFQVKVSPEILSSPLDHPQCRPNKHPCAITTGKGRSY